MLRALKTRNSFGMFDNAQNGATGETTIAVTMQGPTAAAVP
jgi:hypothetical protein